MNHGLPNLLEMVIRAIHDGNGISELDRYLAAGGTVNDRDPVSGSALLHQACEHQNYPVIRALLGQGADVNALAADGSGSTPLHVAVDIDIDAIWQATSDLTKVTFATAQMLLAAGADPDVPNVRGITPRQMAIGYDSSLAERFNRLVDGDTLK